MNNEIKEILRNCEKAINEASGHNDTTDKLLDYITNLQQENKYLNNEFNNMTDYSKDLQQENEELKEVNENSLRYVSELILYIDDYKYCCEKAIEYNKEIVDNYLEEDDCEYCDGRYATAKHNLNILQNGSEEK